MIEEKTTRSGLSSTLDRKSYVDARDYSADGTVTAQAILDAIDAADGAPVYVHGAVNVGSGLVYTGTKAVRLVGHRGRTVLTGTGQNVIDIKGTSAATVVLDGLTVTGPGTSSSPDTDVNRCIRIENRTGRVEVLNCDLSGFANGAGVRVVGGDDVVVRGCRLTNGFDTLTTKASLGGVHITGVVNNVKVTDNTITGPGANPHSIGIFIVGHESFSYVVKDILVHGNRVTGMARHGIGVTHENSTSVFNTGQMLITDNIVKSCKEQGIKIKVAKRVHIQGNTVVDCNTVPELVGELDGGINVQSSSETTIVGNTVIGDGTDGIRFDCKQTGAVDADEGDLGRANHVIASNTVKGAATFGIRVGQAVTDLAVTGNTVIGSGSYGINVDPGTSDSTLRVKRISVTGNVVRKAGNHGIRVERSDDVVVSANVVTMAQNYGIVTDNGAGTVISGNLVRDSGQSGSNTYGIRVGASATSVVIAGNSSKNRQTSSQTYAISLGAAAILEGNDWDGNATGRVHTASNMRHQLGDSTATAKAASPGTASGTDAAVINAVVTALRNLGIVT